MPNKHCCYADCKSDTRRHPDVKFVPFVKPSTDLNRAKHWAHLCGREKFGVKNITRNTYICEKHFNHSEVFDTKNPNLVPYPANSRISTTSRLYRPRIVEEEEEEEDKENKAKNAKFTFAKFLVRTKAVMVPFGVQINNIDNITLRGKKPTCS
jgi:hypothetical protein